MTKKPKARAYDNDCGPSAHYFNVIQIAAFTLMAAFFSTLAPATDTTQTPAEVAGFILEAGNSESEELRLRLLRELERRSDLPPSLRQDLIPLIESVGRWNTSELLNYFRPDKEFRIEMAESSPLYPILALYRGRQLVQHTVAAGATWGGGWENIDEARDYFRIAAEAFPKNRIPRMYLGEPIPSPVQYAPDPNAPEWANLQRESIERLTDVIEWWIDNRQQPDGQFRGWWGDDVELWRKWTPALIAFQDPKIFESQLKLCRGAWSQDILEKGYPSESGRPMEVEHSAEMTSDTLTPMMLLAPEDPEWTTKAMGLAEFMENLWCGRNERGQFQFKGIYIFSDAVWNKSNSDTFYHTRATQPLSLLWLRTGDKRLKGIFTDWMDTWVDIARRAENGKAAGILPSAISWPTGTAGGETDEWWNPIIYADSKENYYSYPSQLGAMTKTLLLTYFMTKDERYLEPIRTTAALYKEYLDLGNPSLETLAPGSRMWAAAQSSDIIDTISKYRLLTGNTEFDSLLAKESDPYLKFRMEGDPRSLLKTLRENIAFQRFNVEAQTTELRATDRLFGYPEVYAHADKEEFPKNRQEQRIGVAQYDASICYQMATGDAGDVRHFPMMAVRWLTSPRHIAALVEKANSDLLEVSFFNFRSNERRFEGECYLLDEGYYLVSILDADGTSLVPSYGLEVKGKATRFTVTLPSRAQCYLRIEKA